MISSKYIHCSLISLLYFTQLQQYQYYSAGLLSNYDKFFDHQRSIVGPKKTKKTSNSSKLKGMYQFMYVYCELTYDFWFHSPKKWVKIEGPKQLW